MKTIPHLIVLGVSQLILTSNTYAASLFDNFDSYADQTALNAVWSTPGTAMTLDTSRAWSSPNSIYQAPMVAQQSRRAIGFDAPVSLLDFSFRFYDSIGTGSYARSYGMLYAYAGGNPSGTLQQILAVGHYGSVTTTKYDGRVAFGGPNWFPLDDPAAPDRSVGWHEARVLGSLVGSTAQYQFYIDDILSKTVSSTVTDPFNWVVMGSGLTSPYGMWYDDVLVVIPEPSTLALGLLGGLGLAGSLIRRRSRQ